MKDPDHNEAGSTSHGDYLYHQQLPEPQRQRLSEKVRSSHPKPGEHKNAARDALMANLKTMGIVLACMIVLLILSAYISSKAWDIKNEVLTSHAPPPPVEETGPWIAPPSEAGEEMQADPARRKQLDTEALRRAVFLSKRAEGLAESGKKQEAIKVYREALSVWPNLTDGWAQIGRLYVELRDFSQAQVALERALESNPASPEILNDLGVAHLFQNRVTKAHGLFTTVAEMDPSYAPTYFNIALCHLARKDHPAAIQSLEHYLRLKPEDPKALKEQAYLFANDRQYGKAMDSLKSALTHAPEWPPLYFDAAATAALMGQFKESLGYLEKAEVLTSPSTVYKIYSQPAFKEVRSSELGELFEKQIAERARERLRQTLPEQLKIDAAAPEPLPSSTPAI